jgi:dienelactone hydrolase
MKSTSDQSPRRKGHNCLSPSKHGVASITPHGIVFQGLIYTCDRARSENWFHIARVIGPWRVACSSDAALVDSILLFPEEELPLEAQLAQQDSVHAGRSAAPRGTVVLLHGYGLAQFAMTPWALRLAEDGWRCVLVDLRGHGDSTGKRIFYGLKETNDLSQLLDALSVRGELRPPVAAVGESYGAALALRWKASEPRVGSVVAIAPYAVLSNSVLNICREYAGWFPDSLLRCGLRQLPSVLEVEPGALDTTTVLARSPVTALFVAATGDKITPPSDVEKLHTQAVAGSRLLVVTDATHESLPYRFDDLVPLLLEWLNQNLASNCGNAGQASRRSPYSESLLPHPSSTADLSR